MSIEGIVQRIRSFVFRANLAGIIDIPLFVGALIIILTVFFWPDVFVGIHLQLLLISLGFICIGLSGVPMIVRREGYSRNWRYMKGLVPAVSGVIIVVVFFTIALVPIVILGLRIFGFIFLNR